MAKPKTTACWYKAYKGPGKGKWTVGEFHKWGMEPGASEGDGCYSVAIIEDRHNGAIVAVPPESVHFGADPDVS